MEQRSNSFCALILVVLGIVIHSYSLNLSPDVPSESSSLLTVFKGMVLLPTIVNLLFIKISLFLLLWGFFEGILSDWKTHRRAKRCATHSCLSVSRC